VLDKDNQQMERAKRRDCIMGHYADSEQKVDGCIVMSTATAVAVIVDIGVPVAKVRGPP